MEAEIRILAQSRRRKKSTMAGLTTAIIVYALMQSGFSTTVRAQSTQDESIKIWQELKGEIFGDRSIQDNTRMVKLTAPKRAQDAGLVPVDIEIIPDATIGQVKSVMLIIDVNPSPMAAKFTLGKDAGVRHISTRVRVNDYSFLRVIAETEDGGLHMTQAYVKASGGCSAPAVKSPDEAKATMGVMKMRQFPPQSGTASSSPRELQLMIRHPNNSGFQMDQITRNFIPPHFVRDLTITQGGAAVLKMEAGISISEDPNFRFDYLAKGNGDIEAEAVDTEGLKFHGKWPLDAGSF
jgi:sulfur-oxidizing protein SoxY